MSPEDLDNPLVVLIRGSNDVASAAARLLFVSGYAVAIHEAPQPTATRRKMAFADAAFDGESVLENVKARLVKAESVRELSLKREFIPFCVDDFSALLAQLRPQVLIDARMRKHHQSEKQRGLAPLTIGLGPNFIAGETTDWAIETGWGDSLGKLILQGATNPLAGEPREIEGHARDRYVYAPVAGIFRTLRQIGELVEQGEEVAWIGAFPLLAPISGALRGLMRDGAPVAEKTKVIEVDPRGKNAQFTGVGERPARIAEGVLQAVESWAQQRARP